MTSAGSVTLAQTIEQAFGEQTEPPTWSGFANPTVDEFSIDNQLRRKRRDGQAQPAGSNEGVFLGSLNVTVDYVPTEPTWLDTVLMDGGTALASSGAATTSTWYVQLEPTSNEGQDRFPIGTRTNGCQIQYQEGEDVTVSLAQQYANEDSSLSAPEAINRPDVGDCATWHDTTFTIDSIAMANLQSWTIDLSPLTRFTIPDGRFNTGAVVNAIEPTVTITAEAFEHHDDRLEWGWGDTDVSDPQDSITSRNATVEIGNGHGDTDTFDLTGLAPTTYSWDALLDAGSPTTDPIEFNFDDISLNTA